MTSTNKSKEKHKGKNASEDSIPSFIRKTYEILEAFYFLKNFPNSFHRKENTQTSSIGAKMAPLSLSIIPQNLLKESSQPTLNTTILPHLFVKYQW